MPVHSISPVLAVFPLYFNIIFFQKKMAHHLPNIPGLYTLMFTIYHHVVVDDVMTDRNMFIFTTFTPLRGLLEMTIQLDSQNTSG